jgi:hypothetical protein
MFNPKENFESILVELQGFANMLDFFYKWPQTLMLCVTLQVCGLYYWWSSLPFDGEQFVIYILGNDPLNFFIFHSSLHYYIESFSNQNEKIQNYKTSFLNSFSNWESWQWNAINIHNYFQK